MSSAASEEQKWELHEELEQENKAGTAPDERTWSREQCAVYYDNKTGETRKGSSVDWQIETLPFEARSTWSLDQLQACLSVTHEGIFCSGLHCRGSPSAIIGPRYRLSTWSDEDLCQRCFTSSPRFDSIPDKTTEPIPAFECLCPVTFVRAVYENITDKMPLSLYENDKSIIYMRCGQNDLLSRRGVSSCLPGEMEGAVLDDTILIDLSRLTGIYLGTELIDDYGKDALLNDLRAGIQATRLVYLLPGDDSSPLTIALQYQRLESARPYVALSYTWKDIELDGPSKASTLGHGNDVQMRDGRRIAITSDLRDALFRIRQSNPVSVHPLWIDQLCIDQSDPEERGLQVDIMWAIFKKAANVTLWIGEEQEGTERAFRIMENVSDGLVSRDWTICPAVDSLEERRAKVKLIMECGKAEQWYCVIEHFQRLVLTRGWVVQELLLANRFSKEVRCGSHTIKFMILALTGLWLSQHGELGLRFVSSICDKVGKGKQNIPQALEKGTFSHLSALRNLLDEGSPIPLSTLLLRCHAFETGDPRDRIYCLLNVHRISLKGGTPPIVPRADYTKTIAGVFTDATRHIIDFERSLVLLQHAGLSSSQTNGLPSWVPDFSWCNDGDRRLSTFSPDQSSYQPRAAGDSVVSVTWSSDDDSNLLQTSSYIVGRIISVGEACDSSQRDESRIRKLLMNWITTVATASNVTLETYVEAGRSFGRMFTCQWFKLEELPSFDNRIARAILRLMVEQSDNTGTQPFVLANGSRSISTNERRLLFTSGERKLNFLFMYLIHEEEDQDPWQNDRDDENPILGIFDELLECITRTMSLRNCFVLDSGYFGLGSRDIQVGDEVHTIQGSGVPFVCRRLEEGERPMVLHKLIGDCHVPGIMDGEAVRSADFEWKSLNLS